MKTKIAILVLTILFTIGMTAGEINFTLKAAGATSQGSMVLPEDQTVSSVTLCNNGMEIFEAAKASGTWTDAGAYCTAAFTLSRDYLADSLNGAEMFSVAGTTTRYIVYDSAATDTTTTLTVNGGTCPGEDYFNISLTNKPIALFMPTMYTTAGYGHGSDGSAYDTAADYAGYNYVTKADLELDEVTPANGYLKRSFTIGSTSGTGSIGDGATYQTATVTDSGHGLPIGARIYIVDAAATGGTDAINAAVVAALEGKIFTILTTADANTFTIAFGSGTDWSSATISAAMTYYIYDIDLSQGAMALTPSGDGADLYEIAGHEHTSTKLVLWFKNYAPSAAYSIDIVKPAPIALPYKEGMTITLPAGKSYADERLLYSGLTAGGASHVWNEAYLVKTVIASPDFANTPYVLDTLGGVVSGTITTVRR